MTHEVHLLVNTGTEQVMDSVITGDLFPLMETRLMREAVCEPEQLGEAGC